jgi:hypothetical protein
MIDGPLWLRGALPEAALCMLDEVNADADRPGARLPLTASLKQSLDPVTRHIDKLAMRMQPVRAVAFDKTERTNWVLPWHQDRVIAVAARHPVAGYDHWSEKQGVWHCQPPTAILSEMLFVRVHLDDADAQTGAMEIAVGSEVAGFVPAKEAESTANCYPREVCIARRGDILVLPMLTLHRSLAALVPASRRVLRIDYAASTLPPPLAWAN